MFNKTTIKDVDVNGKNVLVRVDYNVPIEDGKITSDLRIVASLPTINYLKEHGANRIILCSHLGRPEGVDPELSLKPVADKLKELLPNETVEFVPAVSGDEVKNVADKLPAGGILLLENLRFYPGEKKNSEDFVSDIVAATGANLFVQDGFAVVHRAEASTDAVTRVLPSAAGLLVEKEVSTLSKAVANPEHPVLVIIGGAKVEDKQPLIDKFLGIADQIVVGGKIAADGYNSTDPKIYVAEDFTLDETGAKLDISDKSVAHIIEYVNQAKTIVWNGALGYIEKKPYDTSSRKVAEAISARTGEATTIICGGDTAGFAENEEKDNPNLNYSLISTGGGASLSLLIGEPLPGIDGLETR